MDKDQDEKPSPSPSSPPSPSTTSPSTSTRIDNLDRDVRSLTLQVGQLETNVKNIANSVGDVAQTLKILNNKMSQSGKTDWGLVSSLMAVSLTFMGGVGYLTMSPIEAEIEKLRGWKKQAIGQVLYLSKENAVFKERIRSLERSEFKEPKDQ